MPAALVPEILFEDPNLIVISKPAGLLSQGELKGDPNLVDWLREKFGRPYVGLIHRLDRNTSGAMVVAKRTKAAQRLSEALIKGDLKRTYVAWIEGHLESADWKHYLRKDTRTNEVKAVSPGTSGAKVAMLHVNSLERGFIDDQKVSLVEYILETGRSHQIRVQSAAEKHAILGDRKYGSVSDLISRPALHSLWIEFPHPITKEILKFQAELPEDFKKLQKRIDSSRVRKL